MIGELPQGWAMASLAELTANPKHDVISGPFGSNLKAEEYVTNGVPIIRLQNVDRNRFLEKNMRFIRAQKARELGAHEFRRGDIVITKLGDPLGKACIVPDSLTEGIIVADVVRLRLDETRFSKRYAMYGINSPAVASQINQEIQGTTRPRVNLNDLRDLKIPLAPLNEQRRIVEKVEELLGKVDACQQRLSKIPLLLKRFRQSVLAAASSGRLTADWREENPTTEKIEAVLNSIRKRRQAEAKTAAQKEKLREIFSTVEENDSQNLPESWGYAALTKLCSSFDYGTSAKSKPEGQMPVLRMGNIQNGEIDWTDLVYTSDKDEIEKYALQRDTVLFNRTNSPELVGKTAIYRGERPAIFAGYLIRINPLPELCPEYLNFCLNTNYAREFCQRVKTDGVSQSNINAQKLGSFEVPLPPLAEQQEIVRRMEALFAVADRIEARFTQARAQLDKLTPSLLARAFRGELVPQDPNDEPASALLERIRQTKTVGQASSGKRGRKAVITNKDGRK